MKEIIAKSKFYKQQRQKEFAKTQDQIDELDEDFGDVMDDLRNVQLQFLKPLPIVVVVRQMESFQLKHLNKLNMTIK